MNKTLLFLLASAFACGASAQQYKWVDKDGRVRYGDVPPPGVKATPLRGPATGPAPAPATAAQDGRGAAKGPLTPAEQEAAFRKRQQDAAKAREKDSQSAQEAQQKRENCSIAQDNVRMMESGARISRTDAKGERYFLDDEQRAAELARARKQAADACG